MELMIVGLILFLGSHSLGIFAQSTRDALISRLGRNAYRGIYGLVSLIGLLCIFKGHPDALTSMDWGWSAPVFTKHIAALLMLFACILLVSTYVPNNHIKGKLKHPMILSVKIWAFAHLLANGQGANIVLFASFLIWSVLYFRIMRKRDKAALSDAQLDSKLEQTMSHPDHSGYSGYSGVSTVTCVLLGAAFWALMILGLHFLAFGVYPIIITGLVGPSM